MKHKELLADSLEIIKHAKLKCAKLDCINKTNNEINFRGIEKKENDDIFECRLVDCIIHFNGESLYKNGEINPKAYGFVSIQTFNHKTHVTNPKHRTVAIANGDIYIDYKGPDENDKYISYTANIMDEQDKELKCHDVKKTLERINHYTDIVTDKALTIPKSNRKARMIQIAMESGYAKEKKSILKTIKDVINEGGTLARNWGNILAFFVPLITIGGTASVIKHNNDVQNERRHREERRIDTERAKQRLSRICINTNCPEGFTELLLNFSQENNVRPGRLVEFVETIKSIQPPCPPLEQ